MYVFNILCAFSWNKRIDWLQECTERKASKKFRKGSLEFSYFNSIISKKKKFDVCVTMHHWYNNMNSWLDATMIILLTISISSACVRWSFRPSSGELDCVYSLWYKAPKFLPAGGYRQAETSVFRLIEIVNKIIIVASSWLFILLYAKEQLGSCWNEHSRLWKIYNTALSYNENLKVNEISSLVKHFSASVKSEVGKGMFHILT